MTPQERREALLAERPDAELVIAEAVAEARRNPFAVDENEHEWVTATEQRQQLAEVRADERRRTAEEIKHRGPAEGGRLFNERLARICDEVGSPND